MNSPVDSVPGEHSRAEQVAELAIESVVFNYRRTWLVLITLATIFLAFHAWQIELRAGFQKMIPQDHPYIENINRHIQYVQTPNVVRIIVEAKAGTIFDARYLQILQEINDEVFFIPGVDRGGMKSLWTKNVQWMAVTEEGFNGGVVMADDYDGSAESLATVRKNVLLSGEVGNLVDNSFGSSVVFLPLLDFDPDTGAPLDYSRLSSQLEGIRNKYTDDFIAVRIIGFAKVVGNMIDAIGFVAIFFAIAVVITLILLYMYCRCWRATITPLFCALLAIVWQFGLLRVLGFGLDPFSILVPFLIFAIGVSHAVQNVNYMAIAAANGANRLQAAKESFRRVFAPGLTALVSDGVGFFTLYFIPVRIIQELAIAASIGIAALVFSKLVLLPILMSYTGLTQGAIDKATRRQRTPGRMVEFLTNFTRPGWALVTILLAAALMGYSLYAGQSLAIGDLDKGAPEFHPDSVYNQDVDYVVNHYSSSSDVLIVMVETEDHACTNYDTIESINRFQWAMEHLDGVQGVASTAGASKRIAALLNEGNLKWSSIYRNRRALNDTSRYMPDDLFFNADRCSLSSVYISLDDHKAETLTRVTDAAKAFFAENQVDGVTFLLAAGNAGIEAATNDVIRAKQTFMLVLIYSVVTLMVFLTFLNLQSVVCIILPLTMTSMLCEAVMANLGIGIKIATLPVIVLGVGIGVDYGIYIYARMEHYLRKGEPLRSAYFHTMMSAGKAVSFTGLTLSAGVMTWIFSPLKFQADMGILLMFMFLWNMVGALTLLPALATFFHRGKGNPEPA